MKLEDQDLIEKTRMVRHLMSELGRNYRKSLPSKAVEHLALTIVEFDQFMNAIGFYCKEYR